MKKMVASLMIVLLMSLVFAPAVSAANSGRSCVRHLERHDLLQRHHDRRSGQRIRRHLLLRESP